MLMVVLFPAPLGPRKEKISPPSNAETDAAHRLNAVERVFEVSHLDDIILSHRSPPRSPSDACCTFMRGVLIFPFPLWDATIPTVPAFRLSPEFRATNASGNP